MKEKVTTAEGQSIPLNDLHHQSFTKEPRNDYHDLRNNIIPEFCNAQFYSMYIIDNGLNKDTKSRGAGHILGRIRTFLSPLVFSGLIVSKINIF